MLDGLTNSGAMPVLERMLQFTSARQSMLTHNIANIDTPYFRPRDLDPKGFQAQLGKAVDRRRTRPDPLGGALELGDTDDLRFREDGIDVRPATLDQNVMFHDRNNRDLERIMQSLAENTLAHNVAADFLKSEFDLLKMAIRERI